jgi:5'-nucleotidase
MRVNRRKWSRAASFCASASVVAVMGLATLASGCKRGTRVVTRHEKPKPPAETCMSIVSWNDLHGQLGPDDPQLDLNHVPAGGVIALADEVSDARATGDAVFTLDAGDLFSGPMESTMNEGAPVIDAYRVLGLDAAAIGNHEFDFGPVGYDRVIPVEGKTDADGNDGPRGALLQRMKEASFPFLAANVVREGGAPTAWPNHKPSVVIERGGFKLGVVGYTTKETPRTTLKPNLVGLDFENGAAAAVGREIKALRAQGAAPIVLLAHASLEGELPQSIDDPVDRAPGHQGEIATLLGQLDAQSLPDLVVAGHRHAWLLGRVRGVPIVSTDQHGVGYAKTRFCRKDAKSPIALSSLERRAAIANGTPRTELGREVAKAVEPWQTKVRAEADKPIATLAKGCVSQGPLGTAMLEQLARAVKEHVTDAGKPPENVPVVAVVNAGGLRAPFRAGVLRGADLFAAMPFENAVSVCATTRQGLARALGNLVQRATRDRFPFGIAGAQVRMVRSPTGVLVVESIMLDGDKARPPDPNFDTPVWVAMPDFLLWGGDHFLDGITCEKTATSTTRIRDAWRELLAKEQSCAGPAKNLSVEIPLDRPPNPVEE